MTPSRPESLETTRGRCLETETRTSLQGVPSRDQSTAVKVSVVYINKCRWADDLRLTLNATGVLVARCGVLIDHLQGGVTCLGTVL